jgi:hypothetical protein
MSTKTYEKLDKLLNLYFHPTASPGEKQSALAVYRKMCSVNNINADEYMKTCRYNPNKSSSSRTQKRSSGGSTHRPNYTWEDEGFNYSKFEEDFYNSFFTGRNRYREYKSNQSKQQQSTNTNRGKQKLEFECKEVRFEVKIHNGKRVILMSTLAREFGTDKRFGIQNFCMYSDEFTPGDYFKDDAMKFRFGTLP